MARLCMWSVDVDALCQCGYALAVGKAYIASLSISILPPASRCKPVSLIIVLRLDSFRSERLLPLSGFIFEPSLA